jgi:membrane fusion protein, copper/silver efflux system
MAVIAKNDAPPTGSSERQPHPPLTSRSVWMAIRVAYVRLRFLVVFAIAFLIVGQWSTLRNYWDALTHRGGFDQTKQAISPDTEYFCPMCPGVLSDWPAKCPVCNMALVRRKKGEMTPLPDGVLTRMQFSPYRVQLAGIKTAPVEYRPLFHELRLVGYPQVDAADSSKLWLSCEVPAREAILLRPGQRAEVICDALPGRSPCGGSVRQIGAPGSGASLTTRVLLEVQNQAHELRPGLVVTARIKIAATELDWFARTLGEESQCEVAFDLAVHGLCNPLGVPAEAGTPALLRWAERETAARTGSALAIPAGAIVDTGARKVVYVESGPGMFDGVEVVLGPRFGEHYAVIAGLTPGQQVAAAGVFLIDAESRLNPSIAASYFGASASTSGTTSKSGAPAAPGGDSAAISEALSQLSASERALAIKQKFCPVTGEPLGSMGAPFGVEISGRKVFLCCKGCEKEMRRDAARYLSKLPAP